MSVIRYAIFIAAAALATSAASAAENLSCIDSGYSAEIVADLDARTRAFTFQLGASPDIPEDHINAIAARAGECAELNGWPPEAIEDALLYRMFDVMRGMFRSGSPFTPAQMGRIDQAIASADRNQLHSVVGRILESSFAGEEEQEGTPAENLFLGRLALRAGIAMTESNGEYFGAYLAAVVAPQIYSERFAARR